MPTAGSGLIRECLRTGPGGLKYGKTRPISPLAVNPQLKEVPNVSIHSDRARSDERAGHGTCGARAVGLGLNLESKVTC